MIHEYLTNLRNIIKDAYTAMIDNPDDDTKLDDWRTMTQDDVLGYRFCAKRDGNTFRIISVTLVLTVGGPYAEITVDEDGSCTFSGQWGSEKDSFDILWWADEIMSDAVQDIFQLWREIISDQINI